MATIVARLGRATALRWSLLTIILMTGLSALTTSGWVVGAGFVALGVSTVVWDRTVSPELMCRRD